MDKLHQAPMFSLLFLNVRAAPFALDETRGERGFLTGNPESDIQTLPAPRGTLRRIALHSDCQASGLGGMFIFAPVPSRGPTSCNNNGCGESLDEAGWRYHPPAAC